MKTLYDSIRWFVSYIFKFKYNNSRLCKTFGTVDMNRKNRIR